MLILGLVVGAAVMWGIQEKSGAEVTVREGPAFASGSYEAIAVDGQSYSLLPPWKKNGIWNDTWPPECVPTAGEQDPRPVRLGYVRVEPHGDADGGEVVAWIDCDDSGLD